MIVRLLSFALLLYLVGFFLFAVTLGQPASSDRTDAAVVLTGGSGRIEHAMDILSAGKAKRLLISGADPSVTKGDLAARLGPKRARLLGCCVDLDSTSVDTRSNADETARWLAKHKYKSVRLITSDYHMRRATYEFRRVLGPEFELMPDSVRTEPRFLTLFAEYNDYVLRRAGQWFDV